MKKKLFEKFTKSKRNQTSFTPREFYEFNKWYFSKVNTYCPETALKESKLEDVFYNEYENSLREVRLNTATKHQNTLKGCFIYKQVLFLKYNDKNFYTESMERKMTARSVTLQNKNSRLPKEKNERLGLKQNFSREKNRHKTSIVSRSTENIKNCCEC